MLLNAGIAHNLLLYLVSTITGSQDVDCYVLNAMKMSPEKNMNKHNNLHYLNGISMSP